MKKIFVIRLILFTIFGCIAPFIFIAWRYELFNKVNSMSLSGWGIIAVVIVVAFILYVIKMLNKTTTYSLTRQCAVGCVKIVAPLICLLMAVNSIKHNIDAFTQALIFTIICEVIAIPINPLPKYIYDNNLSHQEGLMESLAEKLKGGNK